MKHRVTDPIMLTRCKPRFHWHLPALLVAATLGTSAPASAQDIASAEVLFEKGKTDMLAGRYDTGCKAIAESQRLDPRAGTLFTLATCERLWGHIATAASRYTDYLAVYERLPPEKKADPIQLGRFKEATEWREKLLPDIPQLTLSLPEGVPPGTVVKRDGEVVGAASLGVSLPVDPGEHTITTQVPGGAAREQRITMARGEKRQVTLEIGIALNHPAAPGDTGPGGRRTATYVLGGVGVAGLVAGTIFGGLAIGQKETVLQHCGAAIGQPDKTACDQAGLDAAGNAKSLALGSTIGLAAGGVALATAAILFFTEAKSAPQVAGTLPVGGVRGWFSAGLISAGPTGGVVGAQAAW